MSAIQLSSAHLAALERRRRVVINYDSLCEFPPFICEGVEPPQLVEYSLSMVDSGEHGIDSVWWCFSGGGEAAYASKLLATFRWAKYHKWIEQGVDLVRLYIEQTKRRGLEVFISCRMNDRDASAVYSDKWTVDYPVAVPQERDEIEPMRKAHPDWLIEVGPDKHQWNYVVPGVREFKLDCLREVAEGYDLDGLELDFCRNIPFLPLGEQWEHRDRLTEFVHAARLMLLEIANKRGRPLLLAARVPDNVEGAKMDGFDLERWAAEQLVDIFVPGARSLNNDVAGFRQITAGTHIKVYPCIDEHHSSDGYGHPPIEVFRGLYSKWISQGADGIQAFNFVNMTRPGCTKIGPQHLMRGEGPIQADGWAMETQNQFYRELVEPANLKYLDKTFAIERRGGGAGEDSAMSPTPENWRTPAYGYCCTNMFAPLPVKLANHGKTQTLLLGVGDDVNAAADRVKQLRLRLLLSDPTATRDVLTGLNQVKRLLATQLRPRGTKRGPCDNVPPLIATVMQLEVHLNDTRLGPRSFEGGWVVLPVQPNQVSLGDNRVCVRLNDRPEDARDQIQIEKIELDVTYRNF